MGAISGTHHDLDLHKGVDADIENAAMLCKPGVGPAAIVTDANGRNAIDDDGLGHIALPLLGLA